MRWPRFASPHVAYKRRRSEWEQTIQMSIRTTRATGTCEQIPVQTRGGQPAHNKHAKTKSQPTKLVPFCAACGWRHTNVAAIFCVQCGTKRDLAADNCGTTEKNTTETNTTETTAAANVTAYASSLVSRVNVLSYAWFTTMTLMN